KGGGHTGAMTGAMVATGIVFFPAAPLFLFMHGKDITIPKGHEVTVYTKSDYDLAKPKPLTTTGPAIGKTVTRGDLSKEDVLKLKQAGLSDPIVIEKIKTSPGKYKLETDDLIALKNAGPSEGIIAAMLQAQPSAQR